MLTPSALLDRRHRWHIEEDPRDRNYLLAVCRACGARRWLSKPMLLHSIRPVLVKRLKFLLALAQRLSSYD